MCIQALEEVGLLTEAKSFRAIQDSGNWTEYALNQISMVQEVAEGFENLEIHSWPGNDLIRNVEEGTRSRLKNLQQKTSPEATMN